MGKKKMNKEVVKWQPISMLPTIAYLIDGVIEGTEEQHRNFSEAKTKPYVLDDAIVNRALKLYKAQLEDIDIYKKQLSRWQKEQLNIQQEQEIVRLAKQLIRAKELTDAVLAMLDEIKDYTIDKILAKDELQVAIDVLTGKLKLP